MKSGAGFGCVKMVVSTGHTMIGEGHDSHVLVVEERATDLELGKDCGFTMAV